MSVGSKATESEMTRWASVRRSWAGLAHRRLLFRCRIPFHLQTVYTRLAVTGVAYGGYENVFYFCRRARAGHDRIVRASHHSFPRALAPLRFAHHRAAGEGVCADT